MKYTGIARKLDPLGRITLPIELRRTLDINNDDALEISVDSGKIILEPVKNHENKCAICESISNLIEIDGQHICLVHAHMLMDKLGRR